MLSHETNKRLQQDHSHMDKSIIVEDLIQKHGAKTIFKATFEWEGSDYAPMLEDADRVPYIAYIAYIAHHRMLAVKIAANSLK